MSKNVAVFVDVANIFYAAKAAGVDIDYVTLLKSATAGRDFVRAYAYTGLDPENENQRQFHSFLSRSGYKVVSKDIRKYGDGRIKANLDIELVVDMMRMAEHIDIAVVVSGDGDFAPAIRAVQQLGVRVEVISFRGNTSSDLIEVADVFTDITHIARVEKGARSGRRVAAEDDLSMTAVPEKETDGGPRRRRGGRRTPEREERVVAEAAATTADASGMPGNLIVLPGEKLSRVGGEDGDELLPDEALDEEAAASGEASDELGAETEGGRRRRRRRGGRGRGRGRRADGELEVAPGAEPAAESDVEDDEFLEEELVPLPQHSTFGSVWDSQLGVPSSAPLAPVAAAGSVEEYDEDEDEPEIPEYLLAERRQQGRARGRGPVRPGQRGRGGGYQSAVDRERYGRSGTSAFGGSMTRTPDRSRPPAARPSRPPQQQAPRQQRPPYQQPPRETERPVASDEPWSEVPFEVQELLRQEMARRQSTGPATAVSPAPARTEQLEEPEEETVVVKTPAPSRARGPRRTAASSSAAADEPERGDEAAPAAKPAAKRSTTSRRKTASPVEAPAEEASPAPPAPKAATRTRRTATKATAPAAAAVAPSEDGSEVPAEAPKPRRRSTKATAAVAGDGDAS